MAEVCNSQSAAAEHLAFTAAAAECHAEAGAAANGVDGEPESWGGPTCAICLDTVQVVDTALVKSCEHTYCVMCILKWACAKESAACPQCKSPLDYLYVHRQLDGSISDYLLPESVCLLKRAPWFTEHLELLAKGPKISSAAAGQYVEEYAYEFDEDYDEEEDLDEMFESRYLNASQRRVIIGNRRWGEHGQVRSGRMYARPVAQAAASSSGTGTRKDGGIGKAGKGRSQPAVANGHSSSSTSATIGTGGSSSNSSSAGNSNAICTAAGNKPSSVANGKTSSVAGAAAVRILNSSASGPQQGPVASPAASGDSSQSVATAAAGMSSADAEGRRQASSAEVTSSGSTRSLCDGMMMPTASGAANKVAAVQAAASAVGHSNGGSSATNSSMKPSGKGVSATAGATQAGAASSSKSHAGGAAAGSSKGSGAVQPATGRRAKRAQRRAAADLNWDDDDYGYY